MLEVISLISCWSPRRQSWSECASAIAAVASSTSGPPEATHAASAARLKEARSGDGDGLAMVERRRRSVLAMSRDRLLQLLPSTAKTALEFAGGGQVADGYSCLAMEIIIVQNKYRTLPPPNSHTPHTHKA